MTVPMPGDPVDYPKYSNDMNFSEFEHGVFDCDHHFYETADSFTR